LDCKTVYDVVLWFKIYINEKASIYFETNEQILIDIVSKVPNLYVYIPNPTP